MTRGKRPMRKAIEPVGDSALPRAGRRTITRKLKLPVVLKIWNSNVAD